MLAGFAGLQSGILKYSAAVAKDIAIMKMASSDINDQRVVAVSWGAIAMFLFLPTVDCNHLRSEVIWSSSRERELFALIGQTRPIFFATRLLLKINSRSIKPLS